MRQDAGMDSASTPTLQRPQEGRWLGGVCAGLAEHLAISVVLVRTVMVGLALLNGAGVIAYLFLWGFAPSDDSEPKTFAGVLTLLRFGAFLTAGGLVVAGLDATGQSPSLGWVAAGLIALGALAVWSQLAASTQAPPSGSRWSQAWVGARLVLGLAIAAVGLILLVTRGDSWREWIELLAVLGAVLAGLALIATPAVSRVWQQLRTEQAARARESERADIAAHLHDSVLQTLALIQRNSDNSEVTRLARAQERELRQWLFAGSPQEQLTLAAALAAVAGEVEDRHGIPLEVVVSGDRAMSDAGQAVVSAMREALVNASVHAAPPISAYVEIGPQGVSAFVRDHGAGFEIAEIAEDRGGVNGSIRDRMARHGGAATFRRRDPGMEVELEMPMARENSEIRETS